jgi:hypothetical protein
MTTDPSHRPTILDVVRLECELARVAARDQWPADKWFEISPMLRAARHTADLADRAAIVEQIKERARAE